MPRVRRLSGLAALALPVLLGLQVTSASGQPPDIVRLTGRSATGSSWIIERPASWNGTVLLWSHGWSPELRPPESAPRGTREKLLAAGYALAASSYSAAGWALAEAVPDQIAVLEEFAARVGKPRRVLAWGGSMGGLVSTALAERDADRIDGVLSMCASSGGALGMMNSGLDGAFAFVTLVAPGAGIRVVGIDDDAANGARAREALAKALGTRTGRARVALASVLAGLPGWTGAAAPPAPDDAAGQAAEMAAAFAGGVFLPRAEQEKRAGGVFSWNTGVDYARQLERSGRRALVARLYAAAGLDLDADLARLNAAPRIAADPAAVAYMMRNFTPSGRIGVPVLTLDPIGDGVTSPSLAAGFVAAVRAAGRGRLVASAWNARAGHCSSAPNEVIAALHALEGRIDTGRWSVSPKALNAWAREVDAALAPTFVDYTPAPLMRPCADRPGACPGYR